MVNTIGKKEHGLLQEEADNSGKETPRKLRKTFKREVKESLGKLHW
jgi:hypothetical protein